MKDFNFQKMFDDLLNTYKENGMKAKILIEKIPAEKLNCKDLVEKFQKAEFINTQYLTTELLLKLLAEKLDFNKNKYLKKILID